MKRKLHWLAVMASLILLGFTHNLSAQITYTANFNNGMNNWSNDYFQQTEAFACNGAGSLIFNIYDFEPVAETISPPIGTSNGGLITLTYKYMLLNFADDSALENSPSWGEIGIFYATSPDGPFTLLQSITPANHIEAETCATKTATFYTLAGTTVYLAVAAVLGNEDADFNFIFDQVSVTQAAPVACSGAPDAATTLASTTALCNGADAVLSLSTGYFGTGYTVQWQQSADNVTYANVPAGGTAYTYTTDQTASTWYRAAITCTNSSQTTNSTPVHIINTGLECPCDVEFFEENGVEAITYVEFAGIQNTSSPFSFVPVENFTGVTPGEVTVGETYDITLKGNTVGEWENYFTVYFDWNHNGDFSDDGESFDIGSIENSTGTDDQEATGSITIPETALAGLTAMRVFKLFDEFPSDPCSSDDSFGQVEDYLVNVTVPQVPELTYVNLQWPATLTLNVGETGTIYAQAYGEGITEAAGAAEDVTAWIGVSTANTNPNTWTETVWVPATFNVQSGNNDEFMATVGQGLTPGTYYYASRFQLDGGDFLYGGYSATGGGFWSAGSNVSGILTVNCDIDAPTGVGPLALCFETTGDELPTEGGLVWYFGPMGDNAIPADVVLTDGTYYVSHVDGDCESTRTAVVIDVLAPVVADAPEDVDVCDLYILPALTNGNYYTGTMGTGVSLMAGDQILFTRTIYVYAEAEGNADCFEENSFVVTLNTLDDITGEHNQSFEVGEGEDIPTLNDLDIEVDEDATVTWYADSALTQQLDPFSEVEDGVTYYAVATLGACETAPFAVTTGVLGTSGFNKTAFTYYPNPVTDVLNLQYNNNIASVTVINLLGQTVLSKNNINTPETQLNLSALTAGTYLVKVTDSNDATSTVKVVKQ
ncbi:T9SS type A sorting domain-containing protein [Flavobacterium sp. RHBU_24]|uniref:T9SS type A sorting domain-containing protein n=1 Tax=Flavobacterium sp. RHBU_24 TaxID=3391185 RepID=UPI0039847147